MSLRERIRPGLGIIGAVPAIPC